MRFFPLDLLKSTSMVPQIRGVLGYGNSVWLQQTLFDHLQNILNIPKDAIETISGADLGKKGVLSHPAFMPTLFQSKKIIFLEDIKDSHVSALEEFIKASLPHVFLCIRGDHLKSSQKVVKWVESCPVMATIGCYEEDARMIQWMLHPFKTILSPEIYNHLQTTTKKYDALHRLLEQINIMSLDKKPIEDQDLFYMIDQESSSDIFSCIDAFFLKKKDLFFERLRHLYQDSSTVIQFLRVLNTYTQRLIKAHILTAQGGSFPSMAMQLSPIVMKPQHDQFQAQKRLWPIEDLMALSRELQGCEIRYKSSPTPVDILWQHRLHGFLN